MHGDSQDKVDYVDVKVNARMSKATNCICDMCGRTTRVIKVDMPKTQYWNGFKKTARYHELWMCETCRDKLVQAVSIQYPTQEGGNNENV